LPAVRLPLGRRARQRQSPISVTQRARTSTLTLRPASPRCRAPRQCEIPVAVMKASHVATLKELGENGACVPYPTTHARIHASCPMHACARTRTLTRSPPPSLYACAACPASATPPKRPRACS
jgi:hypothetical protein